MKHEETIIVPKIHEDLEDTVFSLLKDEDLGYNNETYFLFPNKGDLKSGSNLNDIDRVGKHYSWYKRVGFTFFSIKIDELDDLSQINDDTYSDIPVLDEPLKEFSDENGYVTGPVTKISLISDTGEGLPGLINMDSVENVFNSIRDYVSEHGTEGTYSERFMINNNSK